MTSRFHLTRYFMVTSLVTIIFASVVMFFLSAHQIRQDYLEEARQHAVSVIRHLRHDLTDNFVLPLVQKGESIDLLNEEQFERMDSIVRGVAENFKIRDIYIFDDNGMILYSTMAEHVGQVVSKDNELYWEALNGDTSSAVRDRGAPLDMSEPTSRTSLLETYVPVISLASTEEEGQVANVIETYQELEEYVGKYESTRRQLLLYTVLGSAALFLALISVIRRADRLIEEQTDELIQTNDQLTELSQGLEKEVERRTDQLMAQERLASLGTFAAGLAHEVNNPIATISSCAQGLQRHMRKQPEGQIDLEYLGEYLQLIEAESSRVKNITTSLLDFSRHEVLADPVAFDPIPVIEDAWIPHSDHREIEFSIRTQGVPEPLAMDQVAFAQVVANIVANAVHSIQDSQEKDPAKKGQVRWEVLWSAKSTVFRCLDNGQGFDKQVAPKLVTPFFTTKPPGQGTGLGLALCHSLVSRYRGQLQVTSDGVGQGATVTLTFPS